LNLKLENIYINKTINYIVRKKVIFFPKEVSNKQYVKHTNGNDNDTVSLLQCALVFVLELTLVGWELA
jgi:hypothetical protein